MMRMGDSDPDEVQTPFDGPAGMELRGLPRLPPDPAAEDWTPPVPDDSLESLDAPGSDDGPGEDIDQGEPATAPPTPKRGRGRPRKPPGEPVVKPVRTPRIPRGMSRVDSIRTGTNTVKKLEEGMKHFPKPPVYFFKPGTDNSDPGRPLEFFEYVKKVAADPELIQRMNFYVYRNWPVMLPDDRQVEKTYDVLQHSDLERRYGIGDYHIKLNDGALGKTIAMVNVTGLRNEEYPAVLDPLKVDLADPQNKSWIARQRSKGIKFLGDPGVTEGNEDFSMAENQAMNALAGSLDKTNAALIGMVKEKANAPTPVQSMESEAVSKGLDIVAKAANMGNEMMQTAINRLTERNADQSDPMEVMDKAFSMAKDFLQVSRQGSDGQAVVQANDHSQIIEIMKMQQEQQQKFHDTLFQMQQGQINELKSALERRETMQAVSTEIAQRPKTLIEQINEMKEVKDTMREVLGLGEEGDGGKQSWLAENAPMLIQGLSVLGSVISTGLYNLAVIKSGQGQPAQPPGPEMVLSPEQQQNLREHGIPVGGQPQPAPQPQHYASQNPQTHPTMEGDDMLGQYHQFLGMIQPSLLKAFQEGESGDQYAETMVMLGDNGYFGQQLNGQQVYAMVKENGKPAIMSLIKTFPGIWNVVKLTPQKWEDFMDTFFRAEDLWREQEGGDGTDSPAAG